MRGGIMGTHPALPLVLHVAMDFKNPYEVFEKYDFTNNTYGSSGLSPHALGNMTNSSNAPPAVPTISVGTSVEADHPAKQELLAKSADIKKQLSLSFHANGSQFGGVTKPHSRRNSAYHIKNEDEELSKADQGNERKRRGNINDKIQELLMIVPASYFQDQELGVAAGGMAYDEGLSKAAGTKDGKPNKGQILTQAVEYIQHLQNRIDEDNKKEVELYLRLKTLQLKKQGKENVPISVGATSAEKTLGEIGVGPHSEQYFRAILLEGHGGED